MAMVALAIRFAIYAGPVNAEPLDAALDSNCSVIEISGKHEYKIAPDRLQQVDIGSDLVISFSKLQKSDTTISKTDDIIVELLRRVRDLESERARLNGSQIDVTSTGAITSFQRELAAFDNQVSDLLDALQNQFGLSSDEFLKAFNMPGEAKGYPSLISWLRYRIDIFRKTAAEFRKSREAVRIRIGAFHESTNKPAARVHVRNYDNIPEGELHQVNAIGLRLSNEEINRLREDIKTTQLITNAISEILANEGVVKDNLGGLLENIRQRLKRLGKQIRRILELKMPFQDIVTNIDSAVAGPAPELVESFEGLRNDLNSLQNLYGRINDIYLRLTSPSQADMAAELLGDSGIVNKLQGLAEKLSEAGTIPDSLLNRLSIISGAMQSISNVKIERQWQATIMPILDSATQELRRQLPVTAKFINLVVVPSARLGLGGIAVSNKLGSNTGGYILRPLSAAVDGIVELSRVDLKEGDRVTIRVAYIDAKSDTAVFPEQEVRMKIVRFGTFRDISAQSIFWKHMEHNSPTKLSIAVLANWQYRYRDASNIAKLLINSLGPGFGIHIANVATGDETFAYGMGLNVSLGGSLLSGGLGWDASNNWRRYWLVGINLVSVLHKVADLGK